ncbi:MAG: hypothetical protein ACRDEA_05965 [Microcystaceae cyanobacterium]
MMLEENGFKQDNTTKIKFLYPILFVGEMPDCSSKEEIIKKYSKEITALSEVWIENFKKLSNGEIERVIKTDFHPYNFGVSLMTSGCTAEFHPEKGINEDDDDLRKERLVLSTLCEIPVSKYYLLRLYDNQFANDDIAIFPKILPENIPLYLIFPLYLIIRAFQLTLFRSEQLREVNRFQNVYTTRKSYIRFLFDRYDSIFKLSLIEESLERKIQSLNDSIRTVYLMLTALFTLSISIISLIDKLNSH